MALGLFLFSIIILLLGYPVAFSLSGSAIFFASIGSFTGSFDSAFLSALPERIFGIMNNESLIAIPLFIFMGVMLEKAKLSDNLLNQMAILFHRIPGGTGISICIVGALLAASTGIVGATVVSMGLISLPGMLQRKYDPSLASGIICASGTLGQIIPPSIVLVILGDVISSSYQQAQLDMGVWAPESISVGDLFIGALIPGLLLVSAYILYIFFVAIMKPEMTPKENIQEDLNYPQLFKSLLPPLLLILSVLGSILTGITTPTEAASVGCMGAILLSLFKGQLTRKNLQLTMLESCKVNAMVFSILIGAVVFSLTFRGFSGDEMVHGFLTELPGGKISGFFFVMLLIFVLGFFLDFFEITFVIVPIVGPILLQMGFTPVWLGVMIAINLQTSFLTPPFGFSLFYLRGVADQQVKTQHIYKGVIPFIFIQLFVLLALWLYPELVLEPKNSL